MAATDILLVDDDRDTYATLSDILSELGYTVDTANDGFSALELSERNPYRLALLNYMMSDMDGLELCRCLRVSRPSVEVALVAAWASTTTNAAASEDGVRHVVPKPIDFGVLLPLVEEIVGKDKVGQPVPACA
jgi:DNA-binding response OmpR family regulator